MNIIIANSILNKIISLTAKTTEQLYICLVQENIITEFYVFNKMEIESSKSKLIINQRLIEAAVRVALNKNKDLLIGHTHPNPELFSENAGVYKRTNFTRADLDFICQINQLTKLRKYNLNIFYLVTNSYSYSCISKIGETYMQINIPDLHKVGLENSNE